MTLCNWVSTNLQHRSQPRRNMRGGSSCSGSDERERALISCTGCDPGLPCTVPQGYCRAFTILFPIFTSSVLPTTANGKWLCRVEGKAMLVLCQNTWEQWHVASQRTVKDTNVPSIIPICMRTNPRFKITQIKPRGKKMWFLSSQTRRSSSGRRLYDHLSKLSHQTVKQQPRGTGLIRWVGESWGNSRDQTS